MAQDKGAPPTWRDDDTYLWHTVDILARRLVGRLHERPAVLTAFPPSSGPEERMLAEGPFNLHEFFAAGDGSYMHSTTFVGGSGALGLTLAAGSLAGSALGNARRKAEAERAATPQWHQVDGGILTVSSHGFYLASPLGIRPWSWQGVSAVTVTNRSTVLVQGWSDTGSAVSWMIQSPWAELLFVLWAHARHPSHPQLLSGGWLPPGWVEHARRHGHFPEQQITDITRALGAADG